MRVKGASSREVVCMGKGLRTSMGGVRMGEGVKIYRVLNLPDSFVNLSVWEESKIYSVLTTTTIRYCKKNRRRASLSGQETPI